MPPTTFGVNWLLGLRVEAKNRFSRWRPWRPSWISDRHDFSFFDLQVILYSLASLESIGFSVQEKKQKIDFQDGLHDGHFGFPIGTILATFDLQVTLMLPIKFGVNWPFGSRVEAKNRFSRWRPWRPSWTSDRHDLSYFWSTSYPDAT